MNKPNPTTSFDEAHKPHARRFFHVPEWSLTTKKRRDAAGASITTSEAVLKVVINGDDKMRHVADENDNEFDALRGALLKALGAQFPMLEDVYLESDSFSGSPRVIETMFDALCDAMNRRIEGALTPATQDLKSPRLIRNT